MEPHDRTLVKSTMRRIHTDLQLICQQYDVIEMKGDVMSLHPSFKQHLPNGPNVTAQILQKAVTVHLDGTSELIRGLVLVFVVGLFMTPSLQKLEEWK